ncbi:MAG: NADH-quinone oxidoreductase subunit NuoG [Ardenticatenaceae bacterium]|nr:NADH-quinone oxidoreductase subunit NuoG [Ardenticatenaceae bacterium]
MSDLIKLTIDGVEVEVPKGTLVVDAAKKIGNDIPVFCYHPKMAPVGMCRMCLVEIGYPIRDRATGEIQLDENGKPQLSFRGLQTACTVPVSEGAVVRTTTDVVKNAQRATVEFLLSSHPLDCPICDKGGECPLQNLTMAHGAGTSRMHFDDKLKLNKHVPLGDLIYLDQERCIQCARCIRFQEEVVDDPVIRFHNRGRRTEIVTFSDPGFNSYWSGNTTDICPVGALTSADFRFGARPWEMTPAASLCAQCPVGCNTTMSTRREAKSGGRNVIKRVMPRQNEAVNEIWICDKGRFTHHFADANGRLTKPLIRKNGQLVEASWQEALDLVAGKLQQYKTAVAGISGDRLSNEDLFQFQKLFRQGLGSGNIDLANRRLGGGDVVAKVGLSSGSNLQDLGTGDAIVVVASDLHESAPVWWLRVKQAAERGAALVVLNARPTRLDKHATHIRHYPAGQAVATVRQLVNLAKVETETNGDALANAAEAIAQANHFVAFYGSEGVTYKESEAIARLLANLLLLKNGDGHAGKPNNGLVSVWPHNNTQGAWDMGVHPAFGPGYKAVDAGLDAAAIYTGAANGDVKALYVMGADPVGDGLMAGRGGLDFLVVQELFLTETAAAADVILPAQSWAEREGTYTSGERRVQRYYPAIPPLGENKADWQILAEIGERVGLGKPAFAASLSFRDIANAVPQYKGMDYRSLAKVEEQWPVVGGEDLYYGGTAYDNRAGLGQQWAAAAESAEVAAFDVPDMAPSVPEGLTVIHAAALYTPGTIINHSDVLAPRLAQPTAVINPADAGSVVTGDMVQVAGITAQVQLSDKTPAGLVLLRGIPWFGGTAVAQISKLEKEEELA